MNSMQYNNAKFASCALAILLSLSSATYAAQLSGLTRKMERPEDVKFISLNRPTLAPYAYVRFCANNPQDCNADHDNATLDLTSDKRSVLQRINNEVNARIKPKMDAVGADTWEAAPVYGDCEDYALTKRRDLIKAGWPAHTLRIATARTFDGEGHAVLIVTTAQGDLVLDNRSNVIKQWNHTDLRFLKVQSPNNPEQWFGA